MPGPTQTPEATTTGAPPSIDAVLAEVRTMLAEVIGDDFLLDEELTVDTSFNEDLEIESIEFVALAERLTERYGSQMDFVGWMGQMELDDIIALSVGDLVDFIVANA